MAHDAMSGLIEGLPDEVAFHCLARVSFYYHRNLRLVCRSWRAALCGPEVFKARREAGVSEELLCVIAFNPRNAWQLYDPCRDHWLTLTVMPSQVGYPNCFGVASVAGKLFKLGGCRLSHRLTDDHGGIFATSEVWSYDPFCRDGSRRANMLVPRARFACCSLDGKIIVAGGFTSFGKTISKAELYDPDTDAWRSLPDLPHTHPSACTGVVIGGKFHVLHDGLSAVQILADSRQWSIEDLGWLREELRSHSAGGFILKRHKKSNSPTLFQKPSFKSGIGLGDDLYLIKQKLQDVDVLSVNSNSPAWRKVSRMPARSGIIQGCAFLRV